MKELWNLAVAFWHYGHTHKYNDEGECACGKHRGGW